MTRDASFSFPMATSASLALHSTNASATEQQGLNLNIGPVSLNVAGGAGGVLEAGVESARDGLMDLFGRVKREVNGVRLS